MSPVRILPEETAQPAAAGVTTKEWNGAVESEENGTVESESAAIAEEKSLAGSARAAAGKKSFADLAVSAGAGAESETISWGIWGFWGFPTNQETTARKARFF